MTSSDRIRKYIKECGITQAHISRLTGINPQTLHAILNGGIRLSAENLELICAALNKDPNDFLRPKLPKET